MSAEAGGVSGREGVEAADPTGWVSSRPGLGLGEDRGCMGLKFLLFEILL